MTSSEARVRSLERMLEKRPEDGRIRFALAVEQVVEVALDNPELTPRELAWHITDTEGHFISETSVYRILKSYDLITSPAFDLIKASDKFKNPTKRVNEMWQTDFTYFKVVGWGWYYLCTVLDDFSRYILAWRLSDTMGSEDVQATLDLALEKKDPKKKLERRRAREADLLVVNHSLLMHDLAQGGGTQHRRAHGHQANEQRESDRRFHLRSSLPTEHGRPKTHGTIPTLPKPTLRLRRWIAPIGRQARSRDLFK